MMFKLTKNIASTVLSLAIVGMVYLFVADTYKWWPFESVTETVKIDETPNVVTEIRGIKKFTTACYYGDVTISKEKASDNWLMNLLRQRDRICLIGRGTIRAGYDFEKLPADAVKISGDTLRVKLPPVEVLDTICNPKDCEVFIDDGNWPHDRVQSIHADLQNVLVDDALKCHIIAKASKSGKAQLQKLFKSFGFTTVILT